MPIWSSNRSLVQELLPSAKRERWNLKNHVFKKTWTTFQVSVFSFHPFFLGAEIQSYFVNPSFFRFFPCEVASGQNPSVLLGDSSTWSKNFVFKSGDTSAKFNSIAPARMVGSVFKPRFCLFEPKGLESRKRTHTHTQTLFDDRTTNNYTLNFKLLLQTHVFNRWKPTKITQPYRCCILPPQGAPCSTIDPTSCRGAGHGRYMAHDASAFGSHHGWMDLKYPKRGMKGGWPKKAREQLIKRLFNRWLVDMRNVNHESKQAATRSWKLIL